MIEKYGSYFYQIAKALQILQRLSEDISYAKWQQFYNELQTIDQQIRKGVEEVPSKFNYLGLRASAPAWRRIIDRINDQGATKASVAKEFEFLDRCLRDELETIWFKYLSCENAELYNKIDCFGTEVTNKCPDAITDIDEAGKCLALERPTATVFHLMRAMERGLQLFGGKLGVTLTNEKVWQVILDEVNKAVKAVSDKATKALYAESASHLFNVKLAWRNEVMHPKSSYTLEEATEIFNHVRAFMRHLATKIL